MGLTWGQCFLCREQYLVGPEHSVALPSAQPTLVGQRVLQPAQSQLCPHCTGPCGRASPPQSSKPGQPLELPLSTLRPLLVQPCRLQMCSSQVCAQVCAAAARA